MGPVTKWQGLASDNAAATSTTDPSSTDPAPSSADPSDGSHQSIWDCSVPTLPSVPSVSLPKGGGAIRGMGDKFSTSPATGTCTLSVPVATSPGRNGFGASLSLSYDSGAANGPFGLGWVLGLPSIARKTDKGIPQYRDPAGLGGDTFVITGAEDLVPELAPPAAGSSSSEWTRPGPAVQTSNGVTYNVYAYRPRVEGSFIRIELWANVHAPTTDIHWRSTSPANVLSVYGLTANSRVVDPEDPTRIFKWLLCQQNDRGNALAVEYKAEDSAGVPATLNERNRTDLSRSANRYIKNVFYGNLVSTLVQPDLATAQWCFRAMFDYGEHDAQTPAPVEVRPWLCRKDPFSTNRSGFEVRSYRLCQRVLMFHNFPNEPTAGADCLVRSTNFTYQDDTQAGNENLSLLASISATGYQRSGSSYLSTSLPPLEFTYSNAVIDSQIHEIDPASLENLPVGLDQSSYKWVDLDGEGLSGILTGMQGAWYYKHNMGGGKFGPLQCLPSKPSLAQINPGTTQHLMDLTGDGRLDVVEFGPGIQGFSTRSFENGWEPFRPFTSLPSMNWQNPNLQLVDITGDGLADALIIEPDCLRTFEFLGECGFMDERRWYPPDQVDDEKGPLLIYADQKHTVFLADMTGDGLQDLVQIRNGEVCYWASQGYGRFSPKVTMLQSPWFEGPELFDPTRVRIGDVDGSGTNDIVYLTADGFVDVYLNYAGNAFSPGTRLQAINPVDNLTTVTIVDLLGKGTGCLVWSSSLPGDISRRISYIDLIEGSKPHLLISSINNMGAETRLTYAPSSKFYIHDKEAGHPWVTRLPFPVQVVERVEKFDRVANTYFSTRYSYHHGYFDGVEREFRGFGRVDQLDTEEYNLAGPPPANVDKASWIPPVMTKTWFHTGGYIREKQVSELFEAEYYAEPGMNVADTAAMLLPDSILPASLSGNPYVMTYSEARESVRSLKGSMLRQEIYALDGSVQESEPYLVIQNNFTVQILQPQQPNRHAVFLSTPCESVQYHYDRNFVSVGSQQVADPRVLHALNLAVDPFGNILQSLSVVYGRRHKDSNPQLTILDTTKQQQSSCTLTIKAYTNAVQTVGAYRTPALCETQSFEIINLPVTANPTFTQLVRFSDVLPTMQSLLPGTFDIPFEDWTNSNAAAGQPSRRLLNHKRIIYRNDDFTGPLPLGQQQSLALPYDSFLQILTPGLVQSVYVDSGKLAAADVEETLAGVCNLVHSEGDVNWWIRAGNIFLSPDSADTPAQERAYAAANFYLFRRFRDANYSATFNTETHVTMDVYDLLVTESRDPFGNRVTVGARDPTSSTIVTPGADYRVLAPALVMDPNRNRIAVAYDDLGRMIARAVMGKPEETVGDNLSAVNLRLNDTDTQAYFSNPLANPGAIIGTATSRVVYDTAAYYNSKSAATPQPVRMAVLNREIAVSDLASGSQSPIQHLLSYINGSMAQIQGIAQGDADPATPTTPRWIVSGWTIFDNKGHAIQKYEPFFSASPEYQPNASIGVSSLLMYDPIGRVVATLNPNHSWSKTIYRAWSQESWDVNDTVLISDPVADADVGYHFSRIPSTAYRPSWYDARATGALGPQQQSVALKTAVHAATPSLEFFDPRARTIVAVVEKKYQRSAETTATDVFLSSRTVFDVSGNPREILDANGRLVQIQDVNMLGHTIHSTNMESGERWDLKSVTLQDASTWNSRGFRYDTAYDQMRRPTQVQLTQNGGPPALMVQTVYGESQPDPESNNLRTKGYSVADQSGYKIQTRFDYKGNLLNSTKSVVSAYDSIIDWVATSNPMEPQTYQGSTTYDALNRTILTTNPDGSIVRNTYGVCSLIQSIDVKIPGPTTKWQSILSNVIYNAKGQRLLSTTSNSVQSVYTYDPLTFKLTDLVTSRGAIAFPTDCPQPPVIGWPGCQIQSLHYTFDPVGNITNIVDNAQQTIFFQNQRVEPSQAFTFDSVYQLIEATGREHLGQLGTPSPSSPSTISDKWLQGPGDGNAMGTYNEQYFFDNAGNLQSVKHSGSDPTQPGWTRTYNYAEKSLLEPATQVNNQLSSTSVGGVTDQYSYAGNAGLTGNMTSMPHLSLMQYDYRDQLQATATQRVNSGTPETAWYSYDTGGARLRKLTVNAAAASAKPIPKAERIYLGPFEVYREFAADGTTVTLQRETLSIMNGPQRIALIETRSAGTDKFPAQQIRFQYTNHIGSALLELSNQAQIITYEEFYPFGSSSYQATGSQSEVPKRYRYTGKELDGENGFYYHGARYCAPWLGRWINCDPGGTSTSGPNLYAYANGNPVNYNDPSGMEPRNSSPDDRSDTPGLDKRPGAAGPPETVTESYNNDPNIIALRKLMPIDASPERMVELPKPDPPPPKPPLPDNASAGWTPTLTNNSVALFWSRPDNTTIQDSIFKLGVSYFHPLQGSDSTTGNLTGEWHYYFNPSNKNLVLDSGGGISASVGNQPDQTQASALGFFHVAGTVASWGRDEANDRPAQATALGVFVTGALGSQGPSANIMGAVDYGLSTPAGHFSSVVWNPSINLNLTDPSKSSVSSMVGTTFQFGGESGAVGLLPEVGVGHDLAGDHAWSPVVALGLTKNTPDGGHTNTFSVEFSATWNITGGRAQGFGGSINIGWGTRFLNPPPSQP